MTVRPYTTVAAAFIATVLLVPLQQDSVPAHIPMFNPSAVLDPSQIFDGRSVGQEEDEPGWDCTTQGNRECGNGETR